MVPKPPDQWTCAQLLSTLKDSEESGSPLDIYDRWELVDFAPESFESFAHYAKNAKVRSVAHAASIAITQWPLNEESVRMLFSFLNRPVNNHITELAIRRIFTCWFNDWRPNALPHRHLNGEWFLPHLDKLLLLAKQNQDEKGLVGLLCSIYGINENIFPITVIFIDHKSVEVQTLAILGVATMPETAAKHPDILMKCFKTLIESRQLRDLEDAREAATASLAGLIRQRDLPDGIGQLADSALRRFDHAETCAALLELRALATSEVHVPPYLLHDLAEEWSGRRFRAVKSIGCLGSISSRFAATCTSALLEHARKEPDYGVRAACMLAWRDIGEAAYDAVEYLCAVLTSRHIENHRECAAAALAFVSNQRCSKTISVLTTALTDANPNVRSCAAFALHRITGQPIRWANNSVNLLCRQERYAGHNEAFLSRLSSPLDYPTDETGCDAYLARLADEDPIVRLDSLSALSQLALQGIVFSGAHSAKLTYVEQFLSHQNRKFRILAVEALPVFGASASHLSGRVLYELEHMEYAPTQRFSNVLCKIGNRAAIDDLVTLVKRIPDIGRKREIIAGFGGLLGEYIDSLLFDSAAPDTRLAALLAIQEDRLDHVLTESMLVSLLEDESPANTTLEYSWYGEPGPPAPGGCSDSPGPPQKHTPTVQSVCINLAQRHFPASEILQVKIQHLRPELYPPPRKKLRDNNNDDDDDCTDLFANFWD